MAAQFGQIWTTRGRCGGLEPGDGRNDGDGAGSERAASATGGSPGHGHARTGAEGRAPHGDDDQESEPVAGPGDAGEGDRGGHDGAGEGDAGDTTMSLADRHGKMRELHEGAMTKIRAVLNDEQKAKFDAMQAHRRSTWSMATGRRRLRLRRRREQDPGSCVKAAGR